MTTLPGIVGLTHGLSSSHYVCPDLYICAPALPSINQLLINHSSFQAGRFRRLTHEEHLRQQRLLLEGMQVVGRSKPGVVRVLMKPKYTRHLACGLRRSVPPPMAAMTGSRCAKGP